jgi:hypothetical protein
MRTPKFTPEQVTQAIIDAQGMITIAARRLGCGRKTIYEYMKRHPEIVEAREEAEERMLDFAESKLFTKISDGDMTAIIWFLKTKGKKRGYVERQEMEQTGDVRIRVVRE